MTSRVEEGASPAWAGGKSATPILRELGVLIGSEVKGLLLGVRAVLFFVVYGGTAAAFGSVFTWAVGEMERQLVAQSPALAGLDRQALINEALKSEQFWEKAGPMLERFGGRALGDALASGQLPWIVLIVLVTSTFVLPGLMLLVGYDRVSEDLSTKFSRYVLQRVRRETYLLGKLLAHWLVSFGLIVAVHVVLLALGAAFVADFDAPAILRALPRVWLGMAIFTLPYAAYAMLVSALMTPPFVALAVGAIGLMGAWMASFGPLNGIWMGSWDMALWVLHPTAIGVFLLHAVLIGGAALFVMRGREV